MKRLPAIVEYLRGITWLLLAIAVLLIVLTSSGDTGSLILQWVLGIVVPAAIGLYSDMYREEYVASLPRSCMFLMAVIPSGMLVLAQDRWPYDYYVILRWVVSTAGTVLAICSYRLIHRWYFSAMVLIVVIFNPIVPFHFRKATWAVLDYGAAWVIGWSPMWLAKPGDYTNYYTDPH